MKTLQNHIAGVWEDSRSGAFQDLVNPATEEVVARCPVGCAEDVCRAVDAAVAAHTSWEALPLTERIDLLNRWADAVTEHAAELAELECQEMGKPVGLGQMFIESAALGLRASASQALEYEFEETVPGPGGSNTRIVRRSLGAVAVITPWNFPVPMVLGALGPLLTAGNTVVVKPSERAPMAVTRLFELAGLPAGVANLVLGDVRAGAPLVQSEPVQLVHFTGSVAAGRSVGAETGRLLHRSVLELGGKDPVVIDADVDPEQTAAAVAFGAFVNSGQICTSMERIYVHRAIAQPFIEALVSATAAQTLGDGHDDRTVLGPLVDQRQRDIVHHHVTDAAERGAEVLIGGTVPDGKGFFYPATVLTGVDDTMLVMTQETFGPVAPVMIVDSFEDGLRHASRSRFGLAATVYTNNPDHIAAAERLPAGVVWVNQWQGGGPERLYEPAGDSGMGATGSRAAYDAATRPVSVHLAHRAQPAEQGTGR
ncbi:aldehyde dehydrogenase family protein [Streptomyces carpinensis]|uniref:Aldehyde dehydrogenase family protein n=1 Tax=Streptomyces carpinensis TaxID=66369 RepID=A0ABV1W884_9ACTN|nr:aldehyde dehydrogenase family protein [Streptomyces carpinensis]